MKNIKLISFLIFTSIFFLISKINANSIKNSNFKNDLEYWNCWGAEYSHGSISIESDTFAWKGASQKVYVPADTRYIKVKGDVKTEDVIKGEMTWETAQLTIEYFDRAGKHLDPYPEKTASLLGTNDWETYDRQYKIPDNVDCIDIILALGNAKGKVWFDNISVEFFNSDMNILRKRTVTYPTDYGRWYALDSKITNTGSHYVDWSSLLDAPAGKHGFLKTDKSDFIFEDGTPVKFYGTVLIAHDAFANKEKTDSLISRLSHMGSNMLRLHLIDAEWAEPNIFNNKDNTLDIDNSVIERMDYLIYKCKLAGIYIFFDFLSARQFFENDGVAQAPLELGAKQVGFFSQRLIDLQKRYLRQILEHENIYTKIKYKNEPTIALAEFINETTVFSQFGENQITGIYKDELNQLWNSSGHTGELPMFTLNYDNGFGILENTVRNSDSEEGIKFYKKLEDDYYKEMYNYAMKCGSKTLFTGSNMPEPILAMTESYSHLDFCANDAYWDHPQTWLLEKPWKMRYNAIIDNNSQLNCEYNNTVQQLSYFKVKDKPFIAWGDQTYPNEYQMEQSILLAAYGSLQGWAGLIHHCFGFSMPGTEELDHFEFSRQPEDIALWVALAPAFLKGYIKKAPGEIIEEVSNSQLYESGSYSYFLEHNYQLPLITRVSKKFVSEKDQENSFDPKYNDYFNRESGDIKSETDELIYNYKNGNLTINTPKLQGRIGHNKDPLINLPFFRATVKNPFAAIFAISADDLPLEKSKHIYLVTTTVSKMTDQKYNDDHTKLENKGKLPVLCQYFDGKIEFNSEKKTKVRPLNLSGKMREKLKTDKENCYDLSNEKTFVYDVTFK